MLYTEDGEIIPVDENDLPVLLPHSDDPSKNPLLDEKFLETIINGKPMRREPNTFDTFVCSSWYYLRFLDPKNPDALINKKISTKISQVDFYVGGNEHATGHLVYARMMHKFLHEL
jgi:leucyl-tRNA synthetase